MLVKCTSCVAWQLSGRTIDVSAWVAVSRFRKLYMTCVKRLAVYCSTHRLAVLFHTWCSYATSCAALVVLNYRTAHVLCIAVMLHNP
jgi:hypothetical protein